MGAINPPALGDVTFPFSVPVPEHLSAQAREWMQANNPDLGHMRLSDGVARFADPHLADWFAADLGAGWNVKD